jgi:hypothetical protein
MAKLHSSELEQNFHPPPKRENTETERRLGWGALRQNPPAFER